MDVQGTKKGPYINCGQRVSRQVCASVQSITKTRLFKYTENLTTKKNGNFQLKKSDILRTSAENIDCGYSLKPPRRGSSNEYPQSMFSAEVYVLGQK